MASIKSAVDDFDQLSDGTNEEAGQQMEGGGQRKTAEIDFHSRNTKAAGNKPRAGYLAKRERM